MTSPDAMRDAISKAGEAAARAAEFVAVTGARLRAVEMTTSAELVPTMPIRVGDIEYKTPGTLAE